MMASIACAPEEAFKISVHLRTSKKTPVSSESGRVSKAGTTWFIEGFETPNLKEAKVMLDALG